MKKIFFFICALCALTACHNEPDTVGLSKMTLTTYDASITADGKFEILGTEPIYMVERFYDEKGKI